MSPPARRSQAGLDPKEILERLRSGKRIRRSLSPWGRLNIDRLLPFLCVYRRPSTLDDIGTPELATSVACYLTASGEKRARHQIADLVGALCRGIAADFQGGFLLIEIWARHGADPEDAKVTRVLMLRDGEPAETADELVASLGQIRLPGLGRLAVETSPRRRIAPPGLTPLLSKTELGGSPCHILGIEVPRLYVDSETGKLFPVIHRALRRGLALGINRAVYRFTRAHTTHRPRHYHALGRRSFKKAVWEADAKLAEVSGSFDFLLLTTPRDAEQAWAKFQRSRFDRTPRFTYRPRPFDISLAKRELYSVQLERIEDPTIGELFREQQDELDRKLTMIADRQTPRFVQESLQLFGGVDDDLLQCAIDILDRIPPRAREPDGGGTIDARAFAERAEEEIERLRQRHEGVWAKVEIRRDIPGLMVSRGNLLVGEQMVVPASRVEALLQHEVGTHVLTYFNGLAQPFRQLRVGLPSYDELQEGLAVLAEYFVGGLSRPRLRLLAARVVAVRRMLEGGSFVEVFRELDRSWGLAQRAAFIVTMRVFRGGGHTKDAAYLRGLLKLLDYMHAGHPLEILYVGKIGIQHIPLVEELSFRKVLIRAPLLPTYLDRPEVRKRVQRLREGLAVFELATPSKESRRKVEKESAK